MAKENTQEKLDDVQQPNRRGFVRGAACTISGIAIFVPVAASVPVVLDPVGRKREPGGSSFTRLCKVSDLTTGIPEKFSILEDKTDKWSRYKDAPIGSVYVLKQSEDDPPKLTVFSTICTHLGCSVNYRGHVPDPDFYCPCHNSRFELKTGKPMNNTPPRALDVLNIDSEKLASQGEVWVEYKRFKTNSRDQEDA